MLISCLVPITLPNLLSPALTSHTVCLQYSPPITAGICSDYLDGFATTFERYMFVISLFARNGFYVVLDNQLNDDPTLINEGQDVWLGYWRQIATAVAADQYAVNKVIIDGLNVSSSAA